MAETVTQTRPDDIPEEVWRAAENVMMLIATRPQHSLEHISDFLLAERERCSAVVCECVPEHKALRAAIDNGTHPDNIDWTAVGEDRIIAGIDALSSPDKETWVSVPRGKAMMFVDITHQSGGSQ